MLLSFFMRSSTLSSSSADICPSLLISWEICWDVDSKYYNKEDASAHLGTSRQTRVYDGSSYCLGSWKVFKEVLNHTGKVDVSTSGKALLVYLKAIKFHKKKIVGNHDPNNGKNTTPLKTTAWEATFHKEKDTTATEVSGWWEGLLTQLAVVSWHQIWKLIWGAFLRNSAGTVIPGDLLHFTIVTFILYSTTEWPGWIGMVYSQNLQYAFFGKEGAKIVAGRVSSPWCGSKPIPWSRCAFAKASQNVSGRKTILRAVHSLKHSLKSRYKIWKYKV